MPARTPKRKPKRPAASRQDKKPEVEKRPPSPFAPAAFLAGSPDAVQELCEGLASIAEERFSDLTGTTWETVGQSLAQQLRALGHDLMSFDESAELQEWQATWHHPRGTFSLLLTFRAPTSVEVTWRTDDATFTARR